MNMALTPLVVDKQDVAVYPNVRSMLDLVVQKSHAPEPQAVIKVGVLTHVDAESLQVLFTGEEAEKPCTLAASCLLVPKAGDLVSCLCYGSDIWVQHILVKADGAVAAPISMDQGSLTIRAENIRLSATGTVGVAADKMSLQSRMAKETFDEKFSDVSGNRIEYSKNVVIRASQHANIKADSITQVAVSLMKLDGSQIHMG